LVVIWLLIISWLVVAISNQLRHVDWTTVAALTLTMICLSGLLFLIYLPIGDWLEKRRRLREWKKEHDLDISLLEPPQKGAVASAGAGPRGDKTPKTVGVCPYCQSPITEDEEHVRCPACHTPHHRSCWQENGGCAVYGCRGGRLGAR
jgi:hypothetical protein